MLPLQFSSQNKTRPTGGEKKIKKITVSHPCPNDALPSNPNTAAVALNVVWSHVHLHTYKPVRHPSVFALHAQRRIIDAARPLPA